MLLLIRKWRNLIKFYTIFYDFGINYDTGNSTYCGYNINEEFKLYSKYISLIHIKDRKISGPSVYVGRGDVNFGDFVKNIEIYNYNKNFTFQLYRDNDGFDVFLSQLNWIKKNTDIIKRIKKI